MADDDEITAELALARALRRAQLPPAPAPNEHDCDWLEVLTNSALAEKILWHLATTTPPRKSCGDVLTLCFLVSQELTDGIATEEFVSVFVPPLIRTLTSRAVNRMWEVLGGSGIAYNLEIAGRRLYRNRDRTVRRTHELAEDLARQAHHGGFELPPLPEPCVLAPGVGQLCSNPARRELLPKDAQFLRIVCDALRVLGPNRTVEVYGHVSEYAAPFRWGGNGAAYYSRHRKCAWVLVHRTGEDQDGAVWWYNVVLVCTQDQYMDLMSVVGQLAFDEVEMVGRDLRMAHRVQRAFYVDDDNVTAAWRDKLCAADEDTLHHVFYHFLRMGSCTSQLNEVFVTWQLRDRGKNQARASAATTLTKFAPIAHAQLPLGMAYRCCEQLRRIWRHNRSEAGGRPTGVHAFFVMRHFFGWDYMHAQDILDLDWRWGDLIAFRRNDGVPSCDQDSTEPQLRKEAYDDTSDASSRMAEGEHLDAIQELYDNFDKRRVWKLLKGICAELRSVSRKTEAAPPPAGEHLTSPCVSVCISRNHVHPVFRAREEEKAGAHEKKRKRGPAQN